MNFSELLRNKLKSYDGIEDFDNVGPRICNYLNESFGVSDYGWDTIEYTIKFKDNLLWEYSLESTSIGLYKSLFELVNEHELFQKLKILNEE